MTTKVGKNLRNVYDSVADAVADVSLRVGEKVETLGYYSVNDGGGAKYVVVANATGIDDGYYYHDLDNGLQLEVIRSSLVRAVQAKTWYVDPVLGTDSVGQGFSTGAGAFKTIQFAIDQLPIILDAEYQQTIQLADGTYNESSRASASMARPAIVYFERNLTQGRNVRSGGRMNGPIVIKGNIADKTACVIETNTGYTTATVYCTGGQIAFDSLTLKGKTGVSISEVVITHRMNSYVHMNDVVIDGVNTTDSKAGVVCESGGQVEVTGTSEVKNCSDLLKTFTAGDQIVVSGDFTVENGVNGVIASGGTIKLQITGTSGVVRNCSSYALNCQSGANIIVNGKDTSNRVSIESPVLGASADMSFLWADIEQVVDLTGGTRMFMNTCGHQQTITVQQGSHVFYDDSDSYTTGNTANASTAPLRLIGDATYESSGTVNLIKSGGSVFVPRQRLATFSANGQTLTVNEYENFIVVRGNGGNFNSLLLSPPTLLNQRLTLFADSFNADFVNGSTAEFASGGVALGNSSGVDYASVTLVASDPTGSGTLKWREIGRSPLQ